VPGRDSARRPEQDKAPDAATVNGWVNEMRRQKNHRRADASSGFNNLFEDAT
jgi:hypothetical protein